MKTDSLRPKKRRTSLLENAPEKSGGLSINSLKYACQIEPSLFVVVVSATSNYEGLNSYGFLHRVDKVDKIGKCK
uniref:Uncharacterized protein n=1 Tax=Romanomermis culicivorax TaxID=13658 RepID=A0A915HW55_ROMCU